MKNLIFLISACCLLGCAKNQSKSPDISNGHSNDRHPVATAQTEDTVSFDRLNNEVNILQNYKFPKKWVFHIGEYPMYSSLKDSLADYYFSKLATLSDSIYYLSEISKNNACPSVDLESIYEIYKNYYHMAHVYSADEYRIENFKGGYVYDIPYFAKTLETNGQFMLNLLRDGGKYDREKIGDVAMKTTINYLILELKDLKSNRKDRLFVYLIGNDQYELFFRFFSIKNDTVFLSDFYMDETDNRFLGQKKYFINKNAGKFEEIK